MCGCGCIKRKICLLGKKETEEHFLEPVQVSFLILMLQSNKGTRKKKKKDASILNTQVHDI